jgi:molybdate transport system substrate-binding protein
MAIIFKYGIVGFIFTLFMSSSAMAQLNVMISGGFNGPYQLLLPQFEQATGVKVTTLSGASQGTGPLTIKAQLQKGTRADVVIMSREGLTELMEQNRILTGSDVDLAIAPLGAGVATGSPIPDISTVDTLKKTLLELKTVAVPGSTSGM